MNALSPCIHAALLIISRGFGRLRNQVYKTAALPIELRQPTQPYDLCGIDNSVRAERGTLQFFF